MFHTLFLLLFTTSIPLFSSTSDTISTSDHLAINQTLVSSNSVFELGFFAPSSTIHNYYLGIWYKNIPDKKVVWVANRDDPITSPSTATLTVTQSANLAIYQNLHTLIWSANRSTPSLTNPVTAQILDSGNLVLLSGSGDVLWKSFDHPTDTLLPGMKLGWSFVTNTSRFIQSWKSPDDPSSGDFTFTLNPYGFPEIFLRKANHISYRSGPWNGLRFSGVPEMNTSQILDFKFEWTNSSIYYSFDLKSKSVPSRLVVNSSGVLERFTWVNTSQEWNPYWYAPKDQCDLYKTCGSYGLCDTNSSPVCKCPSGFEPKNPQAWSLRDGSDGCVRKTELDCRTDGFVELRNLKLPESSKAIVVDEREMLSTEECGKKCGAECGCTAFANKDVSGGGSGCVMWNGELEDMREFAEAGQVMYLKVSAADLGKHFSHSLSFFLGVQVF